MICGIDEVGRGPVLGPLVVCGICVKSDARLRKLGVKDSKKLTPAKREELDPKIRRLAKVELIELSANQIDSMREVMTLNEIEAHAFSAIIERFEPEIAYVDAADPDEEKFARMLRADLNIQIHITSRHRADDTYPVVSAASIVAKVHRDARIRQIEKENGEPIGSGYASDPDTVSFLKKWMDGHESFPPHTRKSWGTAKNIMTMKSVRKLDEFE
jgi:ribonuclease HII